MNSHDCNAPPAAFAQASWHNQLPESLRDQPSLKKFQDIPALAQSYLELEHRLASAFPGPQSDPKLWNQLFERLGRPQDPKDYPLPPEKASVPRDKQTVENFRQFAHKIGLLPHQMRAVVEFYDDVCEKSLHHLDEYMIADKNKRVHECTRKIGAPRIEMIRRMTQQSDPDIFAEMDVNGQFEDPYVMSLLTRLMPEDLEDHRTSLGQEHPAFYREDGIEATTGGSFGQSYADAEAEITRLRGDKDFLEAYLTREHPGHDQAVRRMTRLFENATRG